MNILTKGGKIINRGYKGAVMDLYNKNDNDIDTVYNELLKNNPNKIKLVTLNNEIEIDNKEINIILNALKKNNKNTLSKKFLFVSFFFGSSKKNFNNEMDGYKDLIKIFKKNISKYTTIKPCFNYKGNDIYALIFNNNYYVFMEKCYKTLDNIQFTPKLINKCIKDITEVLNILYKNNYIHNDIKPDNIILCKNRFKLIDWESSNYIKNQASTFINSKNGNLVFNHPIKFYKIGIPYIFYKYIYDAEINSYNYLNNLKTPTIITNSVNKSFNKVVSYYNKNKDFYLKIADQYSFAITILYLAEINNIHNFNKQFINKILANYYIYLN